MKLAQPVDTQWRYAALAALAWLAVTVAMALTRSAWFDEMFTAFATDPQAPLSSLIEIWRSEPHPPLHYALLWSLRQLIDMEGIFALRAVGIALSAAFATAALVYWRSLGWPGMGAFALLLFTSPIALFFAEEARSYFLAMFGGLFAGIYLVRAFETREPDAPKARDAAIGAAAALLLGTHLISLAFEYILFGLAVLAMIRERRWAWLRLTLIIGATITLPITAICVATIFGGVADVLSSFWITRRHLLDTVVALPILVGAPLVVTIGWALLRRRDFAERREQVAGAVILAVAASVFLIGVIALIKPMLVPRYLVAPIMALVAPATILLARLVPKLDAVRAVAALAASFALNYGAVRYKLDYSSDWRGPAQALNAAHSCRGAVVPYLIFNHPPDPQNLWRRYFEWYAPGHTFVPATPEALAQSSRQPCPVRLWIANQVENYVPDEYRRAVRDACAAAGRASLRFGDALLIVEAEATIAPGRTREPCEYAEP